MSSSSSRPRVNLPKSLLKVERADVRAPSAWIAQAEAARRLGVSRRQVARWQGAHLRSMVSGRATLVAADDVDRLVARRAGTPTTSASVELVRAIRAGRSWAAIVDELGAAPEDVERVGAWVVACDGAIVVGEREVRELAELLGVGVDVVRAGLVAAVRRLVDALRGELLARMNPPASGVQAWIFVVRELLARVRPPPDASDPPTA